MILTIIGLLNKFNIQMLKTFAGLINIRDSNSNVTCSNNNV